MAWFRGTSRAIDLVTDVAGRLSLSGLWSEIASNRANDGYVFKSQGDYGSDNIVIQLKADLSNHRFFAGIAADYTPAPAGANGIFSSYISEYHYTADAAMGLNAKVNWWLFYNAHRVILATSFAPVEVGFTANWRNSILYLGLLDRMNTSDGGCNVLLNAKNGTSATSYDAVSRFYTLKSSDARVLVTDHFTATPILNKVKDSTYIGETTNFWTGKPSMFNIGVCDGATGSLRGWLDGMNCQSDTIAASFPAQDGDIVQYNGKNYMVFRPYNYSNFTTPTYTVKGSKYVLKDLMFIRMD